MVYIVPGSSQYNMLHILESSRSNSAISDKHIVPEDQRGFIISLVPTIIALLIIIGFGLFIFYMLSIAKVNELEWSRTIYLFSGIEAIAFAATGFLFGKEVHRQEAKSAEIRAENAELGAIRADKNSTFLESNAKALTEVIRIKKGKRISQDVKYESFSDSNEKFRDSKDDMDELLELAEKLFPRR
jgi:hypothetical protein